MGMLSYTFMQRALVAVVMAGILCSTMSFFVVLNRLSFMGAGISHAVLGGLALGMILGLNPIYSAAAFAVLIALVAGYLIRARQVEADTAIGIFFSSGMALGIVMISMKQGYYPQLFSLLFGNLLAVSATELLFMAWITLLVLGFVVFFFKELLAVTFDEDLARTNGLPATGLYMSLLACLALTVVASVVVLGVVLASALLVIPAAAAAVLTVNYRPMLLLSIIIGLASGIAGLTFSYHYDVPSGAAIVLCAATIFAASLVYRPLSRKLRPPGRSAGRRS